MYYKVPGAVGGDVQTASLSESQRLTLLDQLETALSDLRDDLANAVEKKGGQRMLDLAKRIRQSDAEICEIIVPELDLMEFHLWIIQANEFDRALADFQMGDYGYCEICEQTIPFKALRAEPTTRYCGECTPRQNKQTEVTLASRS